MGITSASTSTSTGWWKPSHAFPKCLSPLPTTSACLVSTSRPSTTCALGMKMGWSQISTGKLGIALSWMEMQTQAVGVLWMREVFYDAPASWWEPLGELCCAQLLSHVWLFATLWTIAHQAHLSLQILQARIPQWLPCPPPGDLPNPGIEPRSPAMQTDSLSSEPPEKTWEKLELLNSEGCETISIIQRNGEAHRGEEHGLLVCPHLALWPCAGWVPDISPHGFHATDDIQVSLETQAAKSSDQKCKKSIWRQDAEAPGPGGNPTTAGRVSVTPATFSGHML